MYSFLEIEAIFQNCNNWNDLKTACELFLSWVEPDGDLPEDKMRFIGEMSLNRFSELENL